MGVHDNAFTRVPQALARATALTRLELTSNDELELEDEDLQGAVWQADKLTASCEGLL